MTDPTDPGLAHLLKLHQDLKAKERCARDRLRDAQVEANTLGDAACEVQCHIDKLKTELALLEKNKEP